MSRHAVHMQADEEKAWQSALRWHLKPVVIKIAAKEMHDKGAWTIGQDEKTSVVYGMPKVAYELGAVDYQLPLEQIAGRLSQLADKKRKGSKI